MTATLPVAGSSNIDRTSSSRRRPEAESASAIVPFRWDRVTPELWVASEPKRFGGTVEILDDGYLARDAQGVEIGKYADLRVARAIVEHPAGRAYDRRRQMRRISQPMAIVLAAAGGAASITIATFFIALASAPAGI